MARTRMDYRGPRYGMLKSVEEISKEDIMAHYDTNIHCKICGEYLGTYNMVYDSEPGKEEYYCKDKKSCKKRKNNEIKTRYW